MSHYRQERFKKFCGEAADDLIGTDFEDGLKIAVIILKSVCFGNDLLS